MTLDMFWVTFFILLAGSFYGEESREEYSGQKTATNYEREPSDQKLISHHHYTSI